MVKKSRFEYRFDNFQQAFKRLEEAIDRVKDSSRDDLLIAGLIQTYEFTLELGWKTMKDFLYEKGFDLHGSKDAMKQAFQEGFIKDGRMWMQAIDDRNITAHTYDSKVADDVLKKIRKDYFPLMKELYLFFKNECEKK